MAQDILVPDIGDFHDVEVIDVLVKPGDRVDNETPLVTLETEKATLDVPSTAAGVVKSLAIKKGDRVSKGSVLLTLETGKAAKPAPKVNADAPGDKVVPVEQVPQAKPAPEAVTAEVDVLVPDIGDFHDVEVIDVLVKAGDMLAVDTPLVTLETEKATMEVPSTAAGVVKSLAIKKGDRVSKGSLILKLTGAAAASATAAKKIESAVAAPAPVRQPAVAAPPPATSGTLPPVNEAGFSKAHASPSVRKFARELGVDLSRVKGTGVKGRITADDVKAWVKQTLASGAAGGAALPRIAEVDFSKFGAVEIKPLGRIQKISGPRLHASWINVPHVWQMDEADITDLEAKRNELKDATIKSGVKLTPLAFLMRACVKALQEFPVFNASLDASGQNLVLKKYIHLGFAADTPNGLTVPVIRDADRKDLYELARELATLSEKARDGKLSAAEMQGGSFTISSLGGIGGTSFTPVINAPEVAILGVARSSMKPVFRKDTFVPRLLLPFTLAYDHRVIDGAMGARFTTYLARQLADVKGLLEAVP